jgi:hypothetical protein
MNRFRYHHIGIPTEKKLPDNDYIPELKIYASGYNESPYGIEWMNFENDCDLPELIKRVPHIAFVVDDLEEALDGKEILIEPNSPSDGLTVAFIVDNGAPVELMQFRGTDDEVWPQKAKFR